MLFKLNLIRVVTLNYFYIFHTNIICNLLFTFLFVICKLTIEINCIKFLIEENIIVLRQQKHPKVSILQDLLASIKSQFYCVICMYFDATAHKSIHD